MKIILTRHGETDWNTRKIIQGSADIPLNETGYQQASLLARRLKNGPYQIEHIFTSKQLRASATAGIVSEVLHLPCTVMEGLEEMNLGLWEGLSWPQVSERYPAEYELWYHNRRYTKTPEGECYQDVLERFMAALLTISQTAYQEVLVVTHSANIMTFLSHLNHTPFHEMVTRYKTQNTALLEISSEDLKQAALS